jgi:hypothetical protein
MPSISTLWYECRMAKKSKTVTPGRKGKGLILGRKRFAKISAVEGIVLTAQMEQRAAEFDKNGLSAEQRRNLIVRAHKRG